MNPILALLYLLVLGWYYSIKNLIVCLVVPKEKRFKIVDGEIALITGGGSGIGRLTALRLAKRGCTIVTCDINSEWNDETVKLIKEDGGKAYGYICDVTSRDEIYKMAAHVKQEVGKVTILINNAGVVIGKPFLECPDHLIKRTFDVNLLANVWTVKAFLPDMVEDNHGHIVTISSVAGYAGGPRIVDYAASKFGAVGFDESLRLELATKGLDGIATTVVCPYYINTGMFAGVKSAVIPILEPEYVAEKIEEGILLETKVLFVPWYMHILLIFKLVFPVDIQVKFMELFEVHTSMDEFTGRKQ